MAGEKKTKPGMKKKAVVSADVPSLFRINVEVGNLEEAARFYGICSGS